MLRYQTRSCTCLAVRALRKIRKQRIKEMTKIPNRLHKYVPSMLLFLLFEAVAVTLWLTKDNFFYLLNFSYIGACLGLGTALFTAGKRYARHFVQLAVGSYMLLYLGVISVKICRSKGSGTTCFSAFSKQQLSTTRLQKFSDRCFLGVAGAVTPAGQLWCWTFCPTISRRSHEKKSWASFAM